LKGRPEAKNTARSTVRLGYDGRVHKTFRGHLARERFEHEVRVLKYLEKKGCNFVPRVLETDPETLTLVTSNCGARVERITPERLRQLFFELEQYGVRHEDAYLRNVTYRASDGRFCLIDFEFATILEQPELGPPVPEPDPERR
jgi:tRNA A-37 threonylcarbamoyl transferase component Bud32